MQSPAPNINSWSTDCKLSLTNKNPLLSTDKFEFLNNSNDEAPVAYRQRSYLISFYFSY